MAERRGLPDVEALTIAYKPYLMRAEDNQTEGRIGPFQPAG